MNTTFMKGRKLYTIGWGWCLRTPVEEENGFSSRGLLSRHSLLLQFGIKLHRLCVKGSSLFDGLETFNSQVFASLQKSLIPFLQSVAFVRSFASLMRHFGNDFPSLFVSHEVSLGLARSLHFQLCSAKHLGSSPTNRHTFLSNW